MHCSNWRFALFLLIMSGFWTSFNQIFYTMPEYIRDFTETRPVITLAEKIFGESDSDDPDVGRRQQDGHDQRRRAGRDRPRGRASSRRGPWRQDDAGGHLAAAAAEQGAHRRPSRLRAIVDRAAATRAS